MAVVAPAQAQVIDNFESYASGVGSWQVVTPPLVTLNPSLSLASPIEGAKDLKVAGVSTLLLGATYTVQNNNLNNIVKAPTATHFSFKYRNLLSAAVAKTLVVRLHDNVDNESFVSPVQAVPLLGLGNVLNVDIPLSSFTKESGTGNNTLDQLDGVKLSYTVGLLQVGVDERIDSFAFTVPATTADVSIVKTAPLIAAPGETFDYTLLVTNNGPDTAADVTVTDILPVLVTYVGSSSTSGTTSQLNGTVTANIGSLPSGQSATVTITVSAAALVAITNTATVSTTSIDPNPLNNLSIAVITIQLSLSNADLELDKDAPTSITVGTTFTYTITVTNNGPDPANDVVVTDPILPLVNYVSSSTSQGSVSNVAGVVTANLGTVTVGNPVTIFIDVVPILPGTAANAAVAVTSSVDANLLNNADTAITLLNGLIPGASADLEIDKTGPVTANVGTTFTYTLLVTNNGPDPAGNVLVTDALPVEVAFASATSSQGSVSNLLGVVTADLGTIASGDSATVEIEVVPLLPLPALNTALALTSALDTDVVNNEDTVLTLISGPLLSDVEVSKSAPETVTNGTTFTYTLTVSNNGPQEASNVTVVDPLPAQVAYVSSDSTSGSVSALGNLVTANLGSVAVGTTATINIVVQAILPGDAINVATAASTTLDTNLLNNTDSTLTTINGIADVSITKIAPSTAIQGTTFSYVLIVTNNGPDGAANIVATDVLPANVSYVSSSSTAGSVDFLAGTVTANIGSLPAGGSASVVIIVQANVPGPATNTAAVLSTGIDVNPTNNASVTVTLIEPVITPVTFADVSVVKSGPTTATVGGNFSYSLLVTNNGPDAATSVTVTDVLPAGFVTYVSSSSTTGTTSFLAGVVTAELGTLPPSGSAVVTINVTAALPGVATNLATVGTTSIDLVLTNNFSVAVTVISGLPVALADVSMIKSAPATAEIGEGFDYTLEVINDGPDSASDIVVTDTLPLNVSYVSSSSTAGSTSFTSGVVTANIGTLASGASATVTITVNGTIPGPALNLALATTSAVDVNPLNNIGTAVTVIQSGVALVDLSLDKSAPGTANASGPLEFTLTIENNSASDATSVTVVDPLPGQVTYVSATATNGGSVNHTAGLVTVVFPNVPAGGTETIVISTTVNANATGTAVNTAFVASADVDIDTFDNFDSTLTNISGSANAAPVNSVPGPQIAPQNGQLVFTGGNAISVSDADSSALTVNLSVTQGTLTLGSTTSLVVSGNGTGAITVSGTISALNTGLNGLTYQPPLFFTGGATLTITSTDSTSLSDTDTVSITVIAGAPATDLEITKIASSEFVEAGTTVTYTIVIRNNGPNAGVNVSVVDPLPDNTTLVSTATTGTGVILTTSNSVTYTVAALPVGTVEGLDIVVQIDADFTGLLTNTATVIASNSETDPTNNNASATILVDATSEACPDPDLEGTWQDRTATHKQTTSSAGIRSKVKFRGKLLLVNAGNAITPKTTARFFLSTDQRWDQTDQLVGSKSIKPIKPTKSRKLKVKAKVPPGIDPTGKYLIVVLGNPDINDPNECRLSNNILASAPIPPPQPKKK